MRRPWVVLLAVCACSSQQGGGGPDSGTPDSGATGRADGGAGADAGADAGVDAGVVPGLVYTDPAGGKLRLLRNPSSNASSVVLDLVAVTSLTGFSVGFDLPLDANRVRLGSPALVPGAALPAGTNPTAAAIALPVTGPLKGVLVAAQSQKAAGVGASPADSTLPPGAILFSIRLEVVSGAAPGVVFDGAALPASFTAGLRDLSGNDVARASDFAIGRLELH